MENSQKKKHICFTGGGTAGHVMVNITLIPKFLQAGWNVSYIGSKDGIEKKLVEKFPIDYYEVSTGKLRRYFHVDNFKDPFKVIKGIFQANRIMKKMKPDVIFSKGGFVSVPVVIAGRKQKLPVIIHESDLTPGLANKISIPFASKVCVTFAETKQSIPSQKLGAVGAVVRDELFAGDKNKGLSLCSFTKQKPVLLVMGGSLGARKINEVLRDHLDEWMQHFQIVHLCGKGNIDHNLRRQGYEQLEYADETLPHIMAASDIVLSRAGANSIFELLALHKPMFLIPLSKHASRGDQIFNAKRFVKKGYAEMMEEEHIDENNIVSSVVNMYQNKVEYMDKMRRNDDIVHSDALMQYIVEHVK
ncbi:undecaprenyldiphospho-muramoylpentapeptide beta-N-acetylglucosaminyltransferase [Longirhabdus pacifica]|uniref:undecaprenyldiphospho-muramoylpentapeptide beta-N-acetylglucosaminyltransferase n=1 Tax=Longirhabdus pacifica TaxID=2305227 RepID=UPI0010088A88|nr:undecaprenyldiphospho-muramoylpentapeptide beta-N-acetylglucosaminyltransferase [Longirhabdus pacifica]